jgi:hypothetical protein
MESSSNAPTPHTSSQDGFKPVPSSTSSFGAPYTLAWETLGPCNGVAITTPVPTPPQLGCPRKWIAGADYVAGSLVSMNGQILRCKSTAAMPTLDKLCNQVGYEPFSAVYGGAWQHAWEVVGPCSGTIAPSTAAPASAKPGCPSKVQITSREVWCQ